MTVNSAEAPRLINDANLSPDGMYRYWLTRGWAPGEWVNFICLNPSTADAARDDPTVRRLRGFAQRWGYGGFWLTNLLAYRATYPRELHAAADAIGPDNDQWLRTVASQAAEVVVAWGACDFRERSIHVMEMLSGIGIRTKCLGVTKDGLPKHPLYLRGDTVMHPFWLSPSTHLKGNST